MNYKDNKNGLVICICTYKRPHLLSKLLIDLVKQTKQPDTVIIVDGDSDSGEVLDMLRNFIAPPAWKIIYIPSNYANQPYQRYVGWKVAALGDYRVILYLDDDLRIFQLDAVEKTVAPLFSCSNIVGITPLINFGDISKLTGVEVLVERDRQSQPPLLAKLLGSTKNLPPGGISPTGMRVPTPQNSQEYINTEYLRGGVMGFRMDVLSDDCFSQDMFAMAHLGLGIGEDIPLFRKVATRGQLCLAFCARFEHPYDDPPRCFPTQAFRYGYAVAYSRRLINENYRGFESPRLSDRLILLLSYGGNILLYWWRALRNPKKFRFALACGYTLGAFRGLIQKPTAVVLTPHIDWRQAATAAAAKLKIVKKPEH